MNFFDDDDLALMDEMAAEAEAALSPPCLAKERKQQSPTFDDEEPPAWELPEAMLTGGMPANFEKTRRDVGDLTDALAEKKDKIEELLERMSKLQARYAAMGDEREVIEETLRTAAMAAPPTKRRGRKARKGRKKKRSPRKGEGKENSRARSRSPRPTRSPRSPRAAIVTTAATPVKYAHPLDDLKDFQENENHPCVENTPDKKKSPRRDRSDARATPQRRSDGKLAHPLDDHFELGTEATEEAETEAHIARILEWVAQCREPGADPFGAMRSEIRSNFDQIEATMHHIQGSSTQTFQPKGAETTLLEMLEARENALIAARDDLELMNEETDDAAFYWGNMYICDDCNDNDVDDSEETVCSPEEAQLLLYLGKNLHDYMYNIEAHKDYLVEMADMFDCGVF